MSGGQLVSVIIPTRDRPESVRRAVRSAVDQTHEALEILVVDDCSSVPLSLPTELAQDPRVRVLRLDERSGAGPARNAGVRASRGDLIAFLDDDDEWRATKVARQLEVLAQCGDGVDAVETGYDLWERGRLILRYLPQTNRDLAKALLARPSLQPSTVLLRKSAFEDLGGFDPELTRVEDWDLWVRFSDCHRAAALPEVLVDRQASHTDPAELLRWYREMVRRLEPRIETLPPAERPSVRRVHLIVESELLAALGHRKAACGKALQAWREEPRDWQRPALAVVRSLTGERAWAATKRALRRSPLVRG